MSPTGLLFLVLTALALGFLLRMIVHPLDLEEVARREGVPYYPQGICKPDAVRSHWFYYGRSSLLYPMSVQIDEKGILISEQKITGALLAPLDWLKVSTEPEGRITQFRIITGSGKRIRLFPDAEAELAARYEALVKSGRIETSSRLVPPD